MTVTNAVSNASSPNAPTLVDRAFQLGYKVAYRLMRTAWRLTNPVTHGALVLIRSRDEVLLVRNSYVPYYSAPGGFVKPSEDARDAARRELLEEVGLQVSPDALKLSLELTHPWEYKQDHVKVFELTLDERPVVNVDHREVIEALWVAPQDALRMNVFPPLKRVIREHLAR
jgi:8-oxo-dGTP pyrophosphatase MutT (NUDIX family)